MDPQVVTHAMQLPDPISGGAGWVGAGLLGLLLGWLLLKHLPDKDKQIERLIEGCDRQNSAQMERFDRIQGEIRGEFRNALDQITTQHNKQLEAVLAAFHHEVSAVKASLERGT